jgi:hypothetical protein
MGLSLICMVTFAKRCSMNRRIWENYTIFD